MGIWHNWAVYRRAQVIYGSAIVESKGVNDGENGGKSDNFLAVVPAQEMLRTFTVFLVM